MEEVSKPNTMNSLRWGLISGAAIIVLNLILYLLNLHMNKPLAILQYLVLIAGIFAGTRQFKNKELNGFMTYGKAFGSGFKISMFTGIIVAVYSFLFFQFIAPDVVQELLDQARENIMHRSPQMSEDQLQMAMSWTAKFMTPVMMSIFTFIYYVIAGLIISLITSIFLKKEDTSVQPGI